MNTSQLKRFAQKARRKLLEQVGAKLNFVLTTDSAELREKTEQLKQLRQELGRTTKEQLIEKVAYTWFNRLMALRFMDVNDYQPLGIRIITPKDGYTIPELLDEAKRGNIPEELRINRQKIYDLLDNKIPSNNPQNEAFKELLIASCNHLNTTFPFLFEKINDYTELLLPDDLTSDFSIVRDVHDGMTTQDCKNVEIIGWLYQYYISEKKDKVIGSKAKVKKEDIPAATQLFTPRWIVEYLVQNTLGKLWLLNRPKSKLRGYMKYFVESTLQESEDCLKIQTPEEIKFLDPASGSGHILIYAFDLFTVIYEEEGYSISEIPKLIIENNLIGYEIDERAAQLTGFAILIKAREYDRRAFGKDLQPNILCFQDIKLNSDEINESLNLLNIKVTDEFKHDLFVMQQATNFGSLIIPNAKQTEILKVYEELNQLSTISDVFHRKSINELLSACTQLMFLTKKSHCVVTNPPYMGARKMDKTLKDWLKNNYPKSYQDLFSCFIVRFKSLIRQNYFGGLITLHGWMFVASFSDFRKWLLDNFSIQSLIHIGGNSFPTLNSQVARAVSFCFNNFSSNTVVTTCFDLDSVEKSHHVDKEKLFENYLGRQNFIKRNFGTFKEVNRTTFLHSVADKTLQVFIDAQSFEDLAKSRQGLATGSNDRFVRYWYEVNFFDTYWHIRNNSKWHPYNKGGDYRKWYGNNENIVLWENDGYEIKNFRGKDGKLRSRPQNEKYYFKSGITYSLIGNSDFCARNYGNGFIFDVGGSAIFPKDADLHYLLGLINSFIGSFLLSKLNPTVNFQVGDIGCIPVLFPTNDNDREKLEEAVKESILLSKNEWKIYEQNPEFEQNEILIEKGNLFEDALNGCLRKRAVILSKLFTNEINIDKEFCKIYDIDWESSAIRKKVSVFNSPRIKSVSEIEKITSNYSRDIVLDFMSYFIGICYGRYSIEKEGIILANQGENLTDYQIILSKSKQDCSFLPDEDNIIPMLDEDWFEDDIVGKFHHFLKVTFGEKNFNKNLAFIEEQIGKDIRKYFIKDFYPDHIKRYKKRPIYWMFSSPKGSFNVLIYMHRYTPDTVSNILNKYLKEFIGKLNTRKEHLEHVQVTGSASDKTKAIKEVDSIVKMLVELHEYERDILYPLATERIEIDLDDGVLVNYNKFGKAVKEVKGLNDPATKKKVKQFDWIDTKQIR